jgi:hypothetical protein
VAPASRRQTWYYARTTTTGRKLQMNPDPPGVSSCLRTSVKRTLYVRQEVSLLFLQGSVYVSQEYSWSTCHPYVAWSYREKYLRDFFRFMTRGWGSERSNW